MGRTCSICESPDLEKINAELILGTSYRKIEKQWNTSIAALSRHRQHMVVSEQQAKAVQRLKAEEIAIATTGDDDVLGQVKSLGSRAKRLLDECKDDKDRTHEIAAMKEARGLLELQSRLMGQLGPNTAVQVNVGLQTITTSLEWPILMRVLNAHPEIHDELTAALRGAGL